MVEQESEAVSELSHPALGGEIMTLRTIVLAMITVIISYAPFELLRLIWTYSETYASPGPFVGAFALEMFVVAVGWILAIFAIWRRI